jgi:hypothetical protein
MYRKLLLAAAAFALLGPLSLATADQAEAKPKWKHGGHPAYGGGPPPWAPAHGYRRKERYGSSGYGRGYRSPYGRPRASYYR